MRYRIAILLLLAVLPAMPISIPATAAPVPKSKHPIVYALVYVGNGSNDEANDKLIAKRAELLRGLCNPRYEKDFHVQSLEGTAVLRVWYSNGTPKKQAEIVNEVVEHYLAPISSKRINRERSLANAKRELRVLIEKKDPSNAEVIQRWSEEIKRIEEELRSLPYLLKRAIAYKTRP